MRCYKCNKWCVRANTCTYNCTVWKHRKWTQALQSARLVFFSFFNYSVWAQNFVLEIRIPSFFKRVVSYFLSNRWTRWGSVSHAIWLQCKLLYYQLEPSLSHYLPSLLHDTLADCYIFLYARQTSSSLLIFIFKVEEKIKKNIVYKRARERKR